MNNEKQLRTKESHQTKKPDQRSNNERDRHSVDDDQVLAAIEAAYVEVSLNLILVSTPSIQ
jgi:hypothetical protein